MGCQEWAFSVWAHNANCAPAAQRERADKYLTETLGPNIVKVHGKQTHTINLTNLTKEDRKALTKYLKSLGEEEPRGVIYILRDKKTGEIFKVGQTTTGVGNAKDTAVYARFVRGYLRNQKELAKQGHNVESEIIFSFVKPTERMALTPLETSLRQAVRGDGQRLLWDNSGPRLRDLNNNLITSGNGITAGLPFKNDAIRTNWLARNRLDNIFY